ncbi:MAG: FKBP12-associated protein [Cirrosporium novae-zelandiae]|nr:MAG: FKBP12-associated protein [Cirrosporium novae-zelandiae]
MYVRLDAEKFAEIVKILDLYVNNHVAKQRRLVAILANVRVMHLRHNLKQEVRCNASKNSEGNNNNKLTCNDECLRLERNRMLALALNINPETHRDDHIPYSNATLSKFQENPKWSQTQERELRIFATDEKEKRLIFKPMKAHERAFIHSLAEDFGFDSESVDPEPHRQVFVFKTPKFVMAPMKTLVQCIRIKQHVMEVSATMPETPKGLSEINIPSNGFLLREPQFGLTVEELRAGISDVVKLSKVSLDVSFLPSEEVALKARPSAQTESEVSLALKTLKPLLSKIVLSKKLAKSITLCTLDASLNVLRTEDESEGKSGGWSEVVSKAAFPRMAPRPRAVGNKSIYTVLGSRVKESQERKKALEAEKKRGKENVVDDWEEEMEKEEEREKAENLAEKTDEPEGSADDNEKTKAVKMHSDDPETPDGGGGESRSSDASV